jgi:ribosomal protein S18 acetylase RimI-like enzyme
MTESEIIKYVNDGAIYYLQLFGKATHMEYINNGYYSYIRPKGNEQGVSFVFDVKIENLSKKEQTEKIDEIKKLNMPIWWDLPISENLYKLIFGKEKPKGSADDEELYMAILPNEKPNNKILPETDIKKVDSKELFKMWAKITNDNNNGYQDIHPENHFHLCEDGLMDCYICFKNGLAVSTATIMNNNGIASLEFVATVPEYQKKGFATLICIYAVNEAFYNRAKIITVRAINPFAKKIYSSIGFRIYNHKL